jgi:flagellar hook protein FlgE
MLRSLFTGLSGLKNHQRGLDVIGNNIANVNTVGYKSSRVQFTELLSQTMRGASSPIDNGRGGTNPIQVGLGVGTAAIDVSHQQGNLQSTGNMSDLAIQGNGFFILSDGSNRTFTRAGAFSFDAKGTLVHANGMSVQGWMADSTGNIDTNGSLQAITIPIGQTINANATSNITYAHNLDSRSYLDGTPVIAAGNSSNVSRVYGKYTGDATAVDSDGHTSAISDTIGSHLIEVEAEYHMGDLNTLNGTETLTSLGVTDTSSFRVVIDGTSNSISLSNGLNSSVSEMISSINSQVTGVTAALSGNAIKITHNTAGANSTIYVEDNDFGTGGIAANLFGDGNGKWAAHAKVSGAKTGIKTTDTLTGLDVANNVLRVVVNGTTRTFDLNDANFGVTAADTVDTLITNFNDWVSDSTNGLGLSGTNRFFMGLDQGGSLYIANNTSDTSGYITAYDYDTTATSSNPTDGLAGLFMATSPGYWQDESTNYRIVGNQTFSNTATDTLTSFDATNDLTVNYNGTDYTWDVSASGISSASTVDDMVTAFNTWEGTLGLASGFTMSTSNGNALKIEVDALTAAGGDSITLKDVSNADADGIADLFFASDLNWDDETATSVVKGKTSVAANVTHRFIEEDGGGTHVSSLSFANGDSTVTGLTGVNLISTSDGFKTGTMVINTVEADNHVVSTSVYDSLGNEHTVTLTLTRTADNTWGWIASGIDVTGSGSLTFDSNGKLQSGATSGSISIGAAGGAASLSIAPSFADITQFADPSTLVNTGQDGYPNGALSTYSIDSTGEILGIYTNGLNQSLGQAAVAAFNNPGGLLKVSDSMFISSNNSGSVQIGTASTGGRGGISAGTLEMSNVDVAKEFANMIIYQRGFQANSKIIGTGDELLQTLVNMKR